MLTAMTAVDNIIKGVRSKQNLWEINTEQEYHEKKDTHDAPTGDQQSAGGQHGEGAASQGAAA
jgi:hypothetical protein